MFITAGVAAGPHFLGDFFIVVEEVYRKQIYFFCTKANISNTNHGWISRWFPSGKERHSPLENSEALKKGFDQLVVHFEPVK